MDDHGPWDLFAQILSSIIAPEDIYVDMPVQVTFMPTVDEPDVVLPLFVPA